MTKKSQLVLGLASMLGVSAGATAVSGFAWFTTTKSATVDATNIGVYSKSSALDVVFKSADVGCSDNNSQAHDVNIKGDASTTAKVETFTATEGQVSYPLATYPSALPVVSIKEGSNDPTNGSVQTWSVDSKNVVLSAAPATGAKVTITYYPFAALTDVSSVDGQTMYKPVWTASGEGQYATDINTVTTEGFLRFTMTITATGASPLAVYLDNPHITAAADTDADNAAAARARVALIEDADKNPATANTTKLVLQNDIDVAANNKGINADYVTSGKTANYQSATVYDLNTLSATVGASVLAEPDGTNKKALSAEPGTGRIAANNFVTNIAAGASVDIIVTVWLEGTMGIDASGKFSQTPELGMINVSLPLIAF